MYRGEKIGSGYQRTVYRDKEDSTRVIKTRNSAALTYLHTLNDSEDIVAAYSMMQRLREQDKEAVKTVSELLEGLDRENNRKLAESIANPEFYDNGDYTQDYNPNVGSVLHSLSKQEARYLIDQYPDLHQLHAGYGFVDRVFNVTINCGVANRDGLQPRLTLIDIGEITTNSAEAVDDAKIQRWHKAAAVTLNISGVSLPDELKPYWLNLLDANITPESITSNWNNKLDN